MRRADEGVSFEWSCFVFFFKQKTAYEIGTGDWSSDVCSSDLISSLSRKAVKATAILIPLLGGFYVLLLYPFSEDEIGRASCRERV